MFSIELINQIYKGAEIVLAKYVNIIEREQIITGFLQEGVRICNFLGGIGMTSFAG